MTDRSGKAIAGIFFLLLLAGGSNIDSSSSSGSTSDGGGDVQDDFDEPGVDDPGASECTDGVDNDGDGMTDMDDPDCDPNSPTFNDTEGGV